MPSPQKIFRMNLACSISRPKQGFRFFEPSEAAVITAHLTNATMHPVARIAFALNAETAELLSQ